MPPAFDKSLVSSKRVFLYQCKKLLPSKSSWVIYQKLPLTSLQNPFVLLWFLLYEGYKNQWFLMPDCLPRMPKTPDLSILRTDLSLLIQVLSCFIDGWLIWPLPKEMTGFKRLIIWEKGSHKTFFCEKEYFSIRQIWNWLWGKNAKLQKTIGIEDLFCIHDQILF